jgi:hypothetical protein
MNWICHLCPPGTVIHAKPLGDHLRQVHPEQYEKTPTLETPRTPETAAPPLTLHDTCDGCGFKAVTRVRRPDGGLFDFCGHHYHKHAAALLKHGAELVDDARGAGRHAD